MATPLLLILLAILPVLVHSNPAPSSASSASSPDSSATSSSAGSQISSLVGSLPPCYQSCIHQSPDINCQGLDVGCLCRASNGNFLTDVLTCIKANCAQTLDINTLLSPLELACQLSGSPISPNAIRNAQDAYQNAPANEPYTVSTTSATFITTNKQSSSYYVVTPIPLTLYLSGVSASVTEKVSTTTATVTTTDTMGSTVTLVTTQTVTTAVTSLITTTSVVTSTRGLGSGAGADLLAPTLASNGTSNGASQTTDGSGGAGGGAAGGSSQVPTRITSLNPSLSVSTDPGSAGLSTSTAAAGGGNTAGTPFSSGGPGGNQERLEALRMQVMWWIRGSGLVLVAAIMGAAALL